MKIATWNVNSLRVRLPQVLDWLDEHQPDILALQEIKLDDPSFPIQPFLDRHYHVSYSGQKTYNGVALISCKPQLDIKREPIVDPQRRFLAATISGVRIINLYVPNGQSVGSDKYAYKLDWLKQIGDIIKNELQKYNQLIVLGDFNIAPDDRDVHDPAAWAGSVLVSEPERAALRHWFDLCLVDVFRRFDQPEGIFSWWDYRMAAFVRNRGLRIDLILASASLAPHCQRCWVDITPRKSERPSDHAPVLASFRI